MRKLIPLLFLFSCKPVLTTTTNASACQNPQYVITVVKKGTNQQLCDIVQYAKSTYGSDVTVQNIRQDKVGVVFDVIRCNPVNE